MFFKKIFHLTPRKVGFFGIVLVFFLSMKQDGFLQHLEKKSYDFRLRLRTTNLVPNSVVIADIDEKSLSAYGRWPWPRSIMAQLIRKLSEAEVQVIGFDVIFSEKVSDSSKEIITTLKNFVDQEKPGLQSGRLTSSMKGFLSRLDHTLVELNSRASPDDEFAQALQDPIPIVLGLIFNFDEMSPEELKKKEGLLSNSKICQNFTGSFHVPEFNGMVTNLEKFWNPHLRFGAFNFFPDFDGTSRQTHLVLKVGQSLYPSLALAILAHAWQEKPQCIPGSFGMDAIQIKNQIIPTDSSGGIPIAYYGAERTFSYYSIKDIIDGKIAEKELKDRIVLVGASAPALYDLRITPFSKGMPGVELHASIIQNILDGNFIQRKLTARWVDHFILLAIGLLCIIILPQLSAWGGALFMVFATFGYALLDWFVLFQKGIWHILFFPLLEILVLYIIITLSKYIQAETQARAEREKRAQIKRAFQFYVSSSLVEKILRNPETLKLGGERRFLSVVFSDIRGFTTLSERLNPESLVNLLNEYLTPMTNIILSKNGFLDKYMGDAIMAVFGAPLPLENHAGLACETALLMIQELDILSEQWAKRKIPPLQIGLGVNTGEMAVGNMGSKHRFDYTVMGDHVNLASRLEGANKIYGTNILIGENTQKEVKDQFVFRELDKILVKGKTEAVSIYELMAKKEDFDPFMEELIERFYSALTAYRKQEWAIAEIEFEDLLAFHPEDGPTKTFLERIPYFVTIPPDPHWDGVFQMKTK